LAEEIENINDALFSRDYDIHRKVIDIQQIVEELKKALQENESNNDNAT